MSWENILIMRSGAIGDVLMTTPLIRGVKKKFPKAHISYLVGEWSKDALRNNPTIDELIVFDDAIIVKKRLFQVLRLIKRLRKRKFDLCLVLDKSYLWNLFAFFCGIPARYGFSRGWEGFSNTKSVPFDGTKNELEYYLKIGKMLGIEIKNKKMELRQDKEFADKFVRRNISPDWSKKFMKKNPQWKFWFDNKIIGIGAGGARNPGQEAPLKRWPKERYVSLINRLSGKYHIILFGNAGDIEINMDIIRSVKKSKKKVMSVTNLTIQQSAALIDKCKYFITHDSGLACIAATTKTRPIIIFGPTSEKRFAPKNAVIIKKNIDCSPCYDAYGKFADCKDNKCMKNVEVSNILKKIK